MLYAIYHLYDEDGGIGDSVQCRELIAITDDLKLAKSWCKKHDKKHVYDVPYACLECGELVVEKFTGFILTKDNENYCDPWSISKYYTDKNVDEEEEEGEY